MQVRALYWQTELIFPRFDGIIEDFGNFLAIRTLSNPGFHWGNYLLFERPPEAGDFARWHDLFHQHIAPIETRGHYAFGWDTVNGERGEVSDFEAANFAVEQTVTLTTQAVNPPPKINDEVTVRPLAMDGDKASSDWEQAVQNKLLCRDPWYDLEGYTPYTRNKMARYKAMQQAGLGAWFGAFLGGTLVADCGIFATGDGQSRVARFQDVGTHPDYRRRGICGTLVHKAARYGLDTLHAPTLVMAADPDYHARIYESVGFVPRERLVTVSWWTGKPDTAK